MPRIIITTDDGTVVDHLDSSWIHENLDRIEVNPETADLYFAVYCARREESAVERAREAQFELEGVA